MYTSGTMAVHTIIVACSCASIRMQIFSAGKPVRRDGETRPGKATTRQKERIMCDDRHSRNQRVSGTEANYGASFARLSAGAGLRCSARRRRAGGHRQDVEVTTPWRRDCFCASCFRNHPGVVIWADHLGRVRHSRRWAAARQSGYSVARWSTSPSTSARLRVFPAPILSP